MACSERESLERQIHFLSGLIQQHKTDHSLSGHFTNCTFRRVNSSGLPKHVGPNRFSLINHPGTSRTQLPEGKNSTLEKLKAIKIARRAAGNRVTLLQQHCNDITTTSPWNAIKTPGQPVEKLRYCSSQAIRRLIPATESMEKLFPKVVISSAPKTTTRSPQAHLVVMPTSSCPSKPNLPFCSVVPSGNNAKQQSLYVVANDKWVYEKACFATLSGKPMHSKLRGSKDQIVHDLTVVATHTSSHSKGSTCSSPVSQAKDGRLGTLGTKPFQKVETSTPLASTTSRTLNSEYVWTADAARSDASPVGTMPKVKSSARDVRMLSPIPSLPSHQNKSPESTNCSPVKHSLLCENITIKSPPKVLFRAGLSLHSSSGCSAKSSTSSSPSTQPLMSRYRWKAVSPRSGISAGSSSTASAQTRLFLPVPRSAYKVKSRTKIVKRKIPNTMTQGGSIGPSTLRGQASRLQPKIYCTISKHKIRKVPFSRTPSQGKRGRAKKSQVYVNQKGIRYSASHRGRTLQRIRSPRTESGRSIGGKGFVRSPPVSALELSHSRRLASQALQRSLMVARQAQLRRNKPKEYCIFYNRFGKCNRGEECRYIHDPDKIAVCTRFIRGTCKKTDGSCQFSHKVTKEKMPVCRYYIRGMCNNSDCMYSHVKVSHKAGVCEDFVKGYCPLGAKCKKEHTLECSEFVASGKCSHGATCRLHHPHTRKHKHNAIAPEEGLAHTKKKVRGNGARPSTSSSGKTSADSVTSGARARSRGQQDEDKMSSCNNIGRLPSYIALDESSLLETKVPEPHLAEKAVMSGQALHIKPRF
uniref:zinc finger CCCH domain-containing protein 3 n=1 Tax=Myxine glutinosa TaxID=7769 RepID=UPI00358FB6A8